MPWIAMKSMIGISESIRFECHRRIERRAGT